MPFSTFFRFDPRDGARVPVPPDAVLPQKRPLGWFGPLQPERDDAMEITDPAWLTPDVVKRISAFGRNGDSEAANISPGVASLLKAMGGKGSINPKTGLLEFWAEGSGDLAGSDPGINAGIGGTSDGGAGMEEGAITGTVNTGKLDPSLLDRIGGWLADKTPLDFSAMLSAGRTAFNAMDDMAKGRLDKAVAEGRISPLEAAALMSGHLDTLQVKGEGLFGETTSMGVGPGGINNGGRDGGAGAGPELQEQYQQATPVAAANTRQDNANQLAAQNSKSLMDGLFASRTTRRPTSGNFTTIASGGRGAFSRLVSEAYGGDTMPFSSSISPIGGSGFEELNRGGVGRIGKGYGKWAELLGGLGRDGDSIVAHINPEEATLLKLLGGRGTPNPRTGLLEFAPIDRNSGLGRLIFADTGDAELNNLHAGFFRDYNDGGIDDARRSEVVRSYEARRQDRLRNLNNAQINRFKQTYAGQNFDGADYSHMIGEADNILAARGQREQSLRGATGINTGVGAIDALHREYADRFVGLGDADFTTLTNDIQRRRQQLLPTLSVNDLNRYKSAYAGSNYANLVGEADSALSSINGTDRFLQGVIDRDSGVTGIEGLHSDYLRDWRAASAADREGLTRNYETRRRAMLQGLNDADLNRFLGTYGDLNNLRGEFQTELDRRRTAAAPTTTSWMSQITDAATMLKQLQSTMGGLFPAAGPAQATGYTRDASVAMPVPRRRWRVNPYTGALEAGGSPISRRGFGSTIMV